MPRKSIARGKNLGIRYEERINKLLKNRELQLESTDSAGASDAPDGFFWFKGSRFPIEIKRQNADFAQVELNWDDKTGFIFSDKSKNLFFSKFFRDNTNFLERINRTWSEKPRKFTHQKLTQYDRNWDLDHFVDIKEPIDVSFIESFYNLKEPPVHYIQIENRGFFYLGYDIAELGVPRINGKPYLRARVKTRSASNNKWGFLVAIKMPGINPSDYDIEEKKDRIFPFTKGNHIDNPQRSLKNFF